MKKIVAIFALLVVGILVEIAFLMPARKNPVITVEEGEMIVRVSTENGQQIIRPWLDERNGVYCFFLPSFVRGNHICMDKEIQNASSSSIMGNDIWGNYEWEERRIYEICCSGKTYHIKFMKAENLPTIFIETEENGWEIIDEDKNNKEKGSIQIVKKEGTIEYAGELNKISKRGHATATMKKFPLSITLNEKKALCGLDEGKKWNLLSLFYEKNKMQSKLVYDMAEYLKLEYTSQGTWVDLYFNGEYKGLYMLTEPIDVGEGRVDIFDLEGENKIANSGIDLKNADRIVERDASWYDIETPPYFRGGYLIEKKYNDRLTETQKAWFITSTNMAFEIEAPRHPSEEEVQYISTRVDEIGGAIKADNIKDAKIDIDSFAKQYLIDLIALENDAMRESTFFYMDTDGILESGPLWDYDRGFGVGMAKYDVTAEEGWGGMGEWYQTLYADKEFKGKIVIYYRELLPLLEEMLSDKIDEYAEWIEASREMDETRWGSTGEAYVRYDQYESQIRWLKFFLLQRMEYLSCEWKVEQTITEEELNLYKDEKHTVTLKDENGKVIKEFEVLDGKMLDDLPTLEEGKEWCYESGWIRGYDKGIPVFENLTLVVQ